MRRYEGLVCTDVPQAVGLVAMDRGVLLAESLEEVGLVNLIYVAESLPEKPVESHVGPFLHTALNQHVTDFALVSLADIQFQNLHRALLEVDTVHDHQVNGSPQVN